jgi:hypothetical protein
MDTYDLYMMLCLPTGIFYAQGCEDQCDFLYSWDE